MTWPSFKLMVTTTLSFVVISLLFGSYMRLLKLGGIQLLKLLGLMHG